MVTYRRCGQAGHNVKTYRGAVRSQNAENVSTSKTVGKSPKEVGTLDFLLQWKSNQKEFNKLLDQE